MAELAAVALASNAVQFVDFALSVANTARQVISSANGSSQLMMERSAAGERLKDLVESIGPNSEMWRRRRSDARLQVLCDQCKGIADELLERNQSMSVDAGTGSRRKAKAIGVAIKAVWKRGEIDEFERRLALIRQEVVSYFCVEISENLQSLQNEQRTQFATFQDTTKDGIATIVDSVNDTNSRLDDNLAELKALVEKHGDNAAAQQQHQEREQALGRLEEVIVQGAESHKQDLINNTASIESLQAQIRDLAQSLHESEVRRDAAHSEHLEVLLRMCNAQQALFGSQLFASRGTALKQLKQESDDAARLFFNWSKIYKTLKGLLDALIVQAKTVMSSREIDMAINAGRDYSKNNPGKPTGFVTTVDLMGLKVTKLELMGKPFITLRYIDSPLVLDSPFARSSYAGWRARSRLNRRLQKISANGQYVSAMGTHYTQSIRDALALKRNGTYVCVFWFSTIVALVDPLLGDEESENVITHAFDTGMNMAHLRHIDHLLDANGYMTAAIMANTSNLSPSNTGREAALLSLVRRAQWLANASGMSARIKENYERFCYAPAEDMSSTGPPSLNKATLKQCIGTLLAGLYSVPPPWSLFKADRPDLVRVRYDRALWPRGSSWVEISKHHGELVMLAKEILHWYGSFFEIANPCLPREDWLWCFVPPQ